MDLTQALEEAAEPPEDLAEAVRDELIALWSDLEQAMTWAYRDRWSMQCDWLASRIITLSRMTGLTPRDDIPETLAADGTYDAIAKAAGLC